MTPNCSLKKGVMDNLRNHSSASFCCEFVGLIEDMIQKGDDNSRILAEDILKGRLKHDLFNLYMVKPVRVQQQILKLFVMLVETSSANFIMKVIEEDEIFVMFFLNNLNDDTSSSTQIKVIEILYMLLERDRDMKPVMHGKEVVSVLKDYFRDQEVADALERLQNSQNKDVACLTHNLIIEFLDYFEE